MAIKFFKRQGGFIRNSPSLWQPEDSQHWVWKFNIIRRTLWYGLHSNCQYRYFFNVYWVHDL